MRKSLVILVLFGMLLLPAAAAASGTAIYEQGSKASAQAGAFVARADDPSALFYNPAGMAFFKKGMNLSFNLTYIATDVRYESPTQGSFKNNATNFFLPAFYFTWGVTDRVAVGFSVNAPYNLATDWSEKFPGRFVSRQSKIVTMNYHPAVAFKINDENAIGIGFSYYDSRVLLTRKQDTSALSTSVNPRTYPSPPYPPGIPYYMASEAFLTTDVRDWAWGWDIGWIFRKEAWSFGLTYHDKVTFEYEGHTYFYTDATKLGPLTALFPAENVRLPLTSIPAGATAGLSYKGKALTTEFDVQWTKWSTWGRSWATFSNPTTLSGKPVVPAQQLFIFDWHDTWCYRLGFGYELNDKTELRWGVLYDQAPVPNQTISSVLPDKDRWSVQFGMGHKYGRLSLDWYVMYLQFANADVTADNIYRTNSTGLPTVVLPGQGQIYPTTYPMTADGKYKGTALLTGVQINWKF